MSVQPTVATWRQRQEVQQAIQCLVNTARHEDNRRREQRFTFFMPVTIANAIEFPAGLQAFIREISRSGVGLLHEAELNHGEIDLIVGGSTGKLVQLRTEVLWCRPCGDTWYISGGRFLEVDVPFEAEALEGRYL